MALCGRQELARAACSRKSAHERCDQIHCTRHAGVLRFQPGEEARRFVAVPPGASWAELSIRAGELDTPKVRRPNPSIVDSMLPVA